jgi:hypothetical protein
MDCGIIRGKKHRWRVLWEEHTGKVFIKQADSLFSPRVEDVGKARSSREALSKSDAHINFN